MFCEEAWWDSSVEKHHLFNLRAFFGPTFWALVLTLLLPSTQPQKKKKVCGAEKCGEIPLESVGGSCYTSHAEWGGTTNQLYYVHTLRAAGSSERLFMQMKFRLFYLSWKEGIWLSHLFFCVREQGGRDGGEGRGSGFVFVLAFWKSNQLTRGGGGGGSFMNRAVFSFLHQVSCQKKVITKALPTAVIRV